MWIAICIFRCSLRIIICRFLCCDSLLGGELRQIVICVLEIKIKVQPHFLHKHYRRIISFIYLHCALIRSPVCFIKQTSKTASAHNKTVFFFRNRYQIVWSLSYTVHVTWLSAGWNWSILQYRDVKFQIKFGCNLLNIGKRLRL